MKNFFQIFLLMFFSIASAHSQENEITAVLLSRESDYQYRYKPKTRDQILIDFKNNVVLYRKKSNKKFKTSKIPINYFFKDSINYRELAYLIVGKSNETESNCCFRNYGSIMITIIQGDSSRNYSESFEFGSVISCKEEYQFLILRKIEEEFSKIEKSIFN